LSDLLKAANDYDALVQVCARGHVTSSWVLVVVIRLMGIHKQPNKRSKKQAARDSSGGEDEQQPSRRPMTTTWLPSVPASKTLGGATQFLRGTQLRRPTC
jgi:hypothetical protein